MLWDRCKTLTRYYALYSSTVPVFVQIHQKWRRLYQGTSVLSGSNLEFGMVQLKRAPAQYNHLAGLLDVFKSKLVREIYSLFIIHV